MAVEVNIGPGDVVIMVLIFLAIVVKAVWVTWKANKDKNAENFFLAGRSMPFWAIGFSIFASNIGCEHFVGQAGEAANSGLPVGIYEWSAGILIFLLGWVLAPMYLGLGLSTMPEWFEKRYNKWCRLVFAVVSIFIYILTKISTTVFAGSVLFEVVADVNMWISCPIILILTACYAAAGGLGSVMYTDVGQASIFLIGGFIGMCYVFDRVGGVHSMVDVLDRNGLAWFPTTMRPAYKKSWPWTGMMIGQPLGSVWYWCVDQTLVQRIFAAKDLKHAQGGAALAGFLKILPPFLMCFPGMIARAMYEDCQRTNGVNFSSWCETDLAENSDKAYPYLIHKVFPDGLRGLIIASLVLAMMSSLDSVFNCTSTIFTIDIYSRFIRPDADDREKVWVGRIVTCVTCILGILWLPMIETNVDGLYLVSQSVQSHLCPTLVAVFFCGLFWKGATPIAGLVGLVIGFAFGIVRYIVSEVHKDDCADDDVGKFECMDFNHMVLIIFGLVSTVTIGVSFITPASETSNLDGTTFQLTGFGDSSRVTMSDPLHRQMLLALGVVLLAVMLNLCVGFGYTNNPTTGGEVTISGGLLSIFCSWVWASMILIFMITLLLIRSWCKNPDLTSGTNELAVQTYGKGYETDETVVNTSLKDAE